MAATLDPDEFRRELDQRLSARLVASARRRETRAAQRSVFARNRQAGLEIRHQLKEKIMTTTPIKTDAEILRDVAQHIEAGLLGILQSLPKTVSPTAGDLINHMIEEIDVPRSFLSAAGLAREDGRKFVIGDVVDINDVENGGTDYGTIIDYGTPGDIELYLVNVGNVFGHGGAYEYMLPESRLTFRDSHASDPKIRAIRKALFAKEDSTPAHGCGCACDQLLRCPDCARYLHKDGDALWFCINPTCFGGGF